MLPILLCSVIITRPAIAANCDNMLYRQFNPDKCPEHKFSTTDAVTIAGGVAAIGGIAAIAGAVLGSSGGGGGTTAVQPTMRTYNTVGADVDAVHLSAVISDAEYTKNISQYNEIRLAYSLARGYTGRGSTIAVLDAGDDTWHGSKVAQIASGPIAPGANVETYKIVDAQMRFMEYDKIGDIIAAAQSADIINASWNTELRADKIYSRDQITRLTGQNFIDRMSEAASHGAIFVWAAGNEGAAQSGALSAMPNVVSELNGHFVNVVAWDDKTGALADFSNACGVTKNYCITAPGADINAGKSNVNGTSFAAPIVSAAIAVIREAFPYMTSPEITQLLFETARDLGAPGIDDIYGHGMLDLERATRPVGVALVPISDTVTQPLRRATVSVAIGRNIKSANPHFAYVDKYGRAFDTALSDNITIKNRAMGWEYLNGADTLSMQLGGMEIGIRQSEFMLADGFMQTDGGTSINFVGAHHSIDIGGVQLFHRTRLGVSRPRPAPESMISEFSNIYTADISVGAKYGKWTFRVSVPDAIISGRMTLRTPVGRGADGAIRFASYDIEMSGRPAVEYMIQRGFLTAGFVDNPYGTDEFFVVAKTALRF